MAFLMVKASTKLPPLQYRIRVQLAAHPRIASWNKARLHLFADMINAKPVGNGVFRDAYGFEYKIS